MAVAVGCQLAPSDVTMVRTLASKHLEVTDCRGHQEAKSKHYNRQTAVKAKE